MKWKLLFWSLWICTLQLTAQNINLKGKVLDAVTQKPMAAVNIKLKGEGRNTTSDLEGNFSFGQLRKGAVLEFSYVGYVTQNYTVQDQTELLIQLSEQTNALSEVVVVGYTTKKKKDVTGSIAVVSAKTIDEMRPVKVEQALQGTVAGVVATSQSGAPGSGLDIRIRGVSSNGSNGPLVLIDGFAGSMDLLNPNDIESISVLKDAQAAVYGATGANGVILVTTKKGRKNAKTKITFNSYVGTQMASKRLNLLNATEYALLLNEAYANGGQNLPYPVVTALGTGTDWQSEVLGKAPMSSNDISISGGSDRVTYGFSAAQVAQKGMVGGDKSGFDRTNVRLALGADLSDKWNLQTNIMMADFNRKGLNENGLGSVLYNAINMAPTLSPTDASGQFTLVPATQGWGTEIINPLAQISNTYNSYNLKKWSGTLRLDYSMFEGFKLTGRYGFNSSRSDSKSFNMKVDYGPQKVFNVTRSSVSQNHILVDDYTFDFFAEYEKNWTSSHTTKLTVGTTAHQYKESGLFATGFDVPYNSWDYADISLANGTPDSGVKAVGSYSGIYRRLSYFATLDYSFQKSVFLSGILRSDTSSRFGPENRTAYFMSVLGGWVISDASFFPKNDHFNFAKWRISYGTLGNDAIGDFRFRQLLGGQGQYVFNNELTTGTALGGLANTSIKWEADRKFDTGFDFRFFDNKLDVTLDYYYNVRTDLLIQNVPVSGITGISAPGSAAPVANAGTVRNKGFELTLNYKNQYKGLQYSVGFNASTLQNQVLSVNNGTGYIEGGSFGVGQQAPIRMAEGHVLGAFYGYQMVGIFQNQAQINAAPSQAALGAATAPGDIQFKDVNGDGVIDARDRTYIGKPIPDYILGFNLRLAYKNFDFVGYAYASIGNDMIRNYERTEANLNRLNYVLDRWTGEGSSNTVPRVTTAATNNNLFSSYFVEDASFVRLQNIQLGYTWQNHRWLDVVGLQKIRCYGAANNVLTLTKYRGFDPAANSGAPLGGAIDYGFYPVPRTFMFGINAEF